MVFAAHDAAGRDGGNSRNGTRAKTVLTEICPVEIEVPRDRDASFEPAIVRKRQRRLDGIDEIVLSLTARGLTTGEVAAHFDEVYGAKVSRDTISRITDKVIEEMTEWQNRPLDAVYPVMFVDAIHLKVRDGQVTNRPFYVVIGSPSTAVATSSASGPARAVKARSTGYRSSPRSRTAASTTCASRSATAFPAARRDQHRVVTDPGTGLHPAPDPQHLPLRKPPLLGADGQRPPSGLHRADRGRRSRAVR